MHNHHQFLWEISSPSARPTDRYQKGLHGVQIGLHGRCFALVPAAHPSRRYEKEATLRFRHVLEILLLNEIKKRCHRVRPHRCVFIAGPNVFPLFASTSITMRYFTRSDTVAGRGRRILIDWRRARLERLRANGEEWQPSFISFSKITQVLHSTAEVLAANDSIN